MEKIKVKFWLFEKEEIVEIEVYENENIEKTIEEEFNKWIDNNIQCGYEPITP